MVSTLNSRFFWIASATSILVLLFILFALWFRVIRNAFRGTFSVKIIDILNVAGFVFLLCFFLVPVTSIMLSLLLGFDTHVEDIFNLLHDRTRVTRCNTNKMVICYNGEIDIDGSNKLRNELVANPLDDQILLLRSGGGSVYASEEIAKTIKSYNLKLFVNHFDSKVDCGSGCVSIVASVPKDRRKISPDALFMLHVTGRGLERNYGPLIDILFSLIEKHIDPYFGEHLSIKLGGAKPMSDDERMGQSITADLLESPTTQHGRLRLSIESCPNPNPFNTLEGITLRWSEIQTIMKGDDPVHCPASG